MPKLNYSPKRHLRMLITTAAIGGVALSATPAFAAEQINPAPTAETQVAPTIDAAASESEAVLPDSSDNQEATPTLSTTESEATTDPQDQLVPTEEDQSSSLSEPASTQNEEAVAAKEATAEASPAATPTVAEGVYTITVAAKPNMNVDLYAGNLANGTKVTLYHDNGGFNQRWELKFDASTGLYQVLLNGSSKALTVLDATAKASSKVGVSTYVGGMSQLWKIKKLDGGAFALITALNESLALDVYGANFVDGQTLHLWNQSDTNTAQRWLFKQSSVNVAGGETLAETSWAMETGRKGSGYYVTEVNGQAKTVRGQNTLTQYFYFEDAGDGFYRIHSNQSWKVLTAQGNNQNTDPVFFSNAEADSPRQLWAVRKLASGAYALQNRASGLYLDLPYGAIYQNAVYNSYAGHDAVPQRLYIWRASTNPNRAAIIDDGDYLITNGDGTRSIGAKALSSGSNAELQQRATVDNQTLTFSRIGTSDYYTIKIAGTKLALDVQSGNKAAEGNVWFYQANGTDAQAWKLVQVGESYMLVSKLRDDLVIDIWGGSLRPGTNIQTYRETQSSNQLFKLVPLFASVAKRVDVSEGVYTISIANNDGSVGIGIKNDSASDGANAELSNLGKAERFYLKAAGDRFYQIINLATGKFLDVAGGSTEPGTNVLQWTGHGGQNQLWALIPRGDGGYYLLNKMAGLVLDAQGGSTAAGTNLATWKPNGQVNQRFFLNTADALDLGSISILPQSDNSFAVDVPGGTQSSGTQLIIYKQNDGYNQRFWVTKSSQQGYYRIQAVASSQYLTASGGKVVQSSSSAESSYNLWKLIYNGSGFSLQNKATGQVLSLAASPNNLVGLVLQTANGSANQLFKISQDALLERGVYGFSAPTGGNLNNTGSYLSSDSASAIGATTAQRDAFYLTSAGEGSLVYIRAINNNSYLTASGSGTKFAAFANNNSQVWDVRLAENGRVYLYNVGSGRYLTQSGMQAVLGSGSSFAFSYNRVNDARSTMDGIDVSSWDAGQNMGTVDADFVIVKATQGTWYTNPQMPAQVTGTLSGNKLLGFYHYAEGKDPIAEANFFYSKVKDYVGRAIFVLDWEGDQNASFGKVDVSWCKSFLDRMRQLTGSTPLLYISKSVTRQHNWAPVAAEYPLWVAQYPNYKETGYKTNPWTDSYGTGAWSKPTIFQYTSSGRVSGWTLSKTADLDLFYGNSNLWYKLAGLIK